MEEKYDENYSYELVYTPDLIKVIELQMIKDLKLTSYQLMQRAGRAAFRRINWLYPFLDHWLILTGNGKNGGDGYILAMLALSVGKKVTVLSCCTEDRIFTPLSSPHATQAKNNWINMNQNILTYDAPWPQVDIIIDALLGIGLKDAPNVLYSSLIKRANSYSIKNSVPIFSLDIPSGLMAKTGTIPGDVIQATHTQTFIAIKTGLLIGKARSVVGQLHFDDLGSNKLLVNKKSGIRRLTTKSLLKWIPSRDPCCHKGNNGRLLIIGGDYGLAGSVLIAGEAALRSGAGLVQILTRESHISGFLSRRPELIVRKLTNSSLENALSWSDIILIGPGLGIDKWGKNALSILENYDKPMLWDADALNLLSLDPHKNNNRIITPHLGEAARLLNINVSQIEMNYILSINNLYKYYGGVVVLKSAGTLILEKNHLSIVDVGNASMASGGMGDLLSGIICGLLSQNFSLYDSACIGCIIHGSAADNLAKEKGIRGILATDLLNNIYKFININDINQLKLKI
ncbi:NAD(P)H-hydrate dehydratase [Candidatus Schneideria nysicola]|uniref:NAD(P)H-hydrate dehydratase n=1 Tax=Candidatus Schneideria nysicola TaxID=1081631 RepID=UPI001CAA7387|nr:NAD(P)H-hydrate dehydratase [Candidatus Schneideria nysicola]UAJ66096.1 NAD(P)H-hydrate dehydratase [Candidatus Schneideria nysicola]